MQSSTTVACRALVMLACLIAIPLAAIFGTSLPDIVKGVLNGRWGVDRAAAREVLSEAPPFRSTGTPTSMGGPGTGQASGPAVWPTAGLRAAPAVDTDSWPTVSPLGDPKTEVALAGYESPVEPVAVSSTPPPDRFNLVQQRLHKLGATYYLLETWGNEGQLYRFYCRMAIGGNPDCARHFEATDPDPFGAMAKVLRQVEAWRGVP